MLKAKKKTMKTRKESGRGRPRRSRELHVAAGTGSVPAGQEAAGGRDMSQSSGSVGPDTADQGVGLQSQQVSGEYGNINLGLSDDNVRARPRSRSNVRSNAAGSVETSRIGTNGCRPGTMWPVVVQGQGEDLRTAVSSPSAVNLNAVRENIASGDGGAIVGSLAEGIDLSTSSTRPNTSIISESTFNVRPGVRSGVGSDMRESQQVPDCDPLPQPLVSVCDPLGADISLGLKEKIWQGDYVDLVLLQKQTRNSFLTNNIGPGTTFQLMPSASGFQLQPQTNARQQRITSIEQWTSVFLVYISIYLERHPGRELLKYMDMVRGAARNNGGYGWRDYDVQFRLRQARSPARSWVSINAELWLLLVAGGGRRSSSFLPFQGNMQRPRSGFGEHRNTSRGRSSPPTDSRGAIGGNCSL
ncbi:uncharacterized protein LOC121410509 isoform X2 [Lytechinus variegatus]|uniref:uncharacterized protein LOC121410509 isoform X2 n=1 Tax=Lytechinus variegatus TaxID=7654 RepID=UPI001BB2A448|nr:uncharacterized protein LOC121410509 isoform X2 [Lytechinus variegatus]